MDVVTQVITKEKPVIKAAKPQWEEEFEKTKFATGGGSSFECSDFERMYVELKDFIRSLVEKTRREVTESAAEAVANAYKYGLERAINLIPGECKEKAISDADGYPDGWDKCREESIENIKKELEK